MAMGTRAIPATDAPAANAKNVRMAPATTRTMPVACQAVRTDFGFARNQPDAVTWS